MGHFFIRFIILIIQSCPSLLGDADAALCNSVLTYKTPIRIRHFRQLIDSRVGRLAIELDHKSSNRLLVDGKSSNLLAATYRYFAAILIGVNLPLVEFEVRSRCKGLLTSFNMTINAKPLMERLHQQKYPY